jgi:hypothetical protein
VAEGSIAQAAATEGYGDIKVQLTSRRRGHRLAQIVAYPDLGSENPAPTTPAYEQKADPVIELQLEKAGVRLADLLNAALR